MPDRFLPDHAGARLTLPRLACHTAPDHALPSQTMPAEPCRASPRPTSPCLPRLAWPRRTRPRLASNTVPCHELHCWWQGSEDLEQTEAQSGAHLGVRPPFADANLQSNTRDQVDHIFSGQHPSVITDA